MEELLLHKLVSCLLGSQLVQQANHHQPIIGSIGGLIDSSSELIILEGIAINGEVSPEEEVLLIVCDSFHPFWIEDTRGDKE